MTLRPPCIIEEGLQFLEGGWPSCRVAHVSPQHKRSTEFHPVIDFSIGLGDLRRRLQRLLGPCGRGLTPRSLIKN
ncbi:hypothetical protein O5D80_008646 [Batrachochytrium dendrobatidis]|nr:hypothetical protein O5D80_008646 [Batrachochytrium dendrobatidis]